LLQETVLAGWAVSVGLTAVVGVRTVLVMRSRHGTAASKPSGAQGADESARLAVERLLDEVGGVVDLIEADAARLEQADSRTLTLASSLLSSSLSRYRDRITSEG